MLEDKGLRGGSEYARGGRGVDGRWKGKWVTSVQCSSVC